MHPHLAAARPPLSPAALLALGLCLAVAALLVAHGPIAQLANYHGFADTRGATWLPNVANVLSNLPFLLVGAVGWWRLRGAGQAPGASAWRVAAIGIALTAFGSTAYHASPSNDTLVLDRLPIAWACAALGCAFAAERFDRRWASRPALAAALALATAAVMHWWLTERGGQGDLRAYLAV